MVNRHTVDSRMAIFFITHHRFNRTRTLNNRVAFRTAHLRQVSRPQPLLNRARHQFQRTHALRHNRMFANSFEFTTNTSRNLVMFRRHIMVITNTNRNVYRHRTSNNIIQFHHRRNFNTNRQDVKFTNIDLNRNRA